MIKCVVSIVSGQFVSLVAPGIVQALPFSTRRIQLTKRTLTKQPAAKKRGPRARGSSVSKPKKMQGRTKATKEERKATHSVRRKPRTRSADGVKAATRSPGGINAKNFTKKQIADKKKIFVETFREKGIIRAACEAAGIRRGLHSSWKRSDPTFAEDCEEALEDAVDRIEKEMIRRGIDGFERPIIYQGKITGQYKDYSDALLITLAKGMRPQRYKDRTEHTTPKGQPLEVNVEHKGEVVSKILGMIQSKPDG